MTTEEFEAIYRKYYEWIRRLAENHVGSDAAGDVAQEVFCTAWRQRGRIVTHDNIKWWLVKTTKYKILEQYRKGAGSSERLGECYPEAGREEPDYEAAEWKAVLCQVMGQKDCELFWEHFYHGITVGELAAKVNVREECLRMRLHRLKKKIQEMML